MPDSDAALIAAAEFRVQTTAEIVARQRLLIVSLERAGLSLSRHVSLLRLFEDNLAIFEWHLALVRETYPVPIE